MRKDEEIARLKGQVEYAKKHPVKPSKHEQAAPVEADNELDEILGSLLAWVATKDMREMDVPEAKTALLAWRDKAVVAELKSILPTETLMEIVKNRKTLSRRPIELAILDRIAQLKDGAKDG